MLMQNIRTLVRRTVSGNPIQRRRHNILLPNPEKPGQAPFSCTISVLSVLLHALHNTHGTYSFTSHPKDEAIMVKCLAQGHKRRDRPGRDSNPHSDNTITWVQCKEWSHTFSFTWYCLSGAIIRIPNRNTMQLWKWRYTYVSSITLQPRDRTQWTGSIMNTVY